MVELVSTMTMLKGELEGPYVGTYGDGPEPGDPGVSETAVGAYGVGELDTSGGEYAAGVEATGVAGTGDEYTPGVEATGGE